MDNLTSHLTSLHLGPSPRIASSSPPVYTHLPSSTHFRILTIEPGLPSSPIRARLSLAHLAAAPPYAAISYVWGAPFLSPQQITVNDTEFNVTQSLHWALARARRPDCEISVWADAVCINQSDVCERGVEVAIMGQIYALATKVLVCLGACLGDDGNGSGDVAAEGVVSLLGSLQWLVDRPEEEVRQHLSREARDDVRWHHLATLTSHPWFGRAWVAQEVGLARDPWMLWGSHEFSYRLLMATKRFMFRWAWGAHLRIASLAIHREWEDWLDATAPVGNAGERYTLLDLLDHASLLDCKDPRDKVYAFLGHPLAQLPNGAGPVIIPDYRKTPLEVFRDIAIHLLQSDGLRVLGSAEHTEQSINDPFPSWVVRWDVALVSNNISQLVPSPRPSNPSSGIIVDTDRLRFMGVLVDKIVKSYVIELGETHISQTTFRDTSLFWPAAGGDGSITTESPTYSHLVQYLQQVDTACAYAGPNSPEEREAAFALTLCISKTHEKAVGDDFCATMRMRYPETREPESGGNPKLVEMISCFQSASYSRSFFVTQRGYYGLGPMICQAGDVCAVALGARVPYVLRPVEDMEYEGGLYKYCGEAYVHHMMDGEALEMQRRGALRPELISLC